MNLFEAIHDRVDILSVVEKHVKLKKTGANFTGRCPFHEEKTASFTVNVTRNIYKCFGCGKGGDAINFVQNIRGYAQPIEAAKELAREYNIAFDDHEQKPRDENHYKKIEGLRLVMDAAAEFYRQQLFIPANALALEYVNSRVPANLIEKFEIGFAPPGWETLKSEFTSKGWKLDALVDAGLVKENDTKKTFDFFRNRIIFPIQDHTGRVLSFGGRDFSGDKKAPKYLNGPDTEIYHKDRALYGLNHALKRIREKDGVYLVEGYMDVIAMHRVGVENTVAPCGTALTIEQIKLIARFTTNITLIYDGDAAGQKAISRNARLIIENGLNCNVIPLPFDEETKADPDSFFISNEQFKKYKEENIYPYVEYDARQKAETVKDYPDRKEKAIKEISALLVHFSELQQNLYIEKLYKIIGPKKLWTDTLKELKKESDISSTGKTFTDEQNEMYHKYGFYVQDNSYYFSGKSGTYEGSNFILTPLFHVESVINAKRLFEIKNRYNHTRVIELAQKDLVALSRFKERVESLGNFIWYGTEVDLNRLKGFLYENTQTCTEITQLGWQPDKGFFAWGNGIFNGTFQQVNEFGIVSYKERNYYIPAFSKIYESEKNLFMSEKKFIHVKKTADITLHDYVTKLIVVFGDNAAVAICFLITALFRDVVVSRFNFFPILDLFGPKGAGKTELAVSLTKFFGPQPKGPNINSTSKPALADHVASVANAIVHIDEYKNSLEFEKIEFLKGLWDGTGRTRMNMEKDRKKETTSVDTALVLSGQEMPTADIALFSRLIFLTFHQVEYSDEEKQRFNELKDIEKKGITHLTEEILSHRDAFRKNFDDSFKKVSDDMQKKLEKAIIEERVLKNWLVVLTGYHALSGELSLPFTYSEMLNLCAKLIREQHKETKRSNELSIFWSIVEYLVGESAIQEDVDFRFTVTTTLNTDILNNVEFKAPVEVMYMQLARVIPLYRKHGHQMKENVLPSKTLEYYLQNDTKYLGKSAQRFSVLLDGTKTIDTGAGNGKRKTKTAKCMAFNYSELKKEFTLHRETESVYSEVDYTEKEDNTPF